jgi:DNA polymerase-3 subunit delta
MKYQSLVTFEKHLLEAFPNHFSPVYMVVCSCDFERKKIIEKIIHSFRKKDPSLTVSYFDAAEVAVEVVLQDLNSQSLFGSCSLVVCDRADKFKDNEKLIHYLEAPHRSSCLILGASTMKPISQLYLKGKKETVVVDLSEEKPWDKRKRLQEWLVGEAKQAKKTLGSDVTSYLLDATGLDVASLSQEMSKLICYVGDKPHIALSDVKAVATGQSSLTGWQLAEGVIWGNESVDGEKSGDLGFLLMFIGQLRYQLQTGYQIASYLDQPEEAARLFPNLRPQILEKYLTGARQKKASFFHRGLLALFELEVAAKSSNTDLSLLFDRFIAKLRA